MDDLVIDSGVAIKWFVAESDSASARRILNDYYAGKFIFHAPDFIYAEFGNIMWKKQAFQGFDRADAESIVRQFKTQVTLTLTATQDLLEEAYKLAVIH